MDTLDEGPLELTRSDLAEGVAKALSEMSILAANRWSRANLARYGKEFLANTPNLLDAYRSQAPHSFTYLCQAMALRIAIIHRHTGQVVGAFGREWPPPAAWRSVMPSPMPIRALPEGEVEAGPAIADVLRIV